MTLKYQSQTYPTGLSPISMVTGDFNHDSVVDLAVINADSDTLSVMLGNNNGTFQTQLIYPTGNGSSPREIATGDFNNDTFVDLGKNLSMDENLYPRVLCLYVHRIRLSIWCSKPNSSCSVDGIDVIQSLS
jgi:hypothetical protein